LDFGCGAEVFELEFFFVGFGGFAFDLDHLRVNGGGVKGWVRVNERNCVMEMFMVIFLLRNLKKNKKKIL
jgi:hypothetical protein